MNITQIKNDISRKTGADLTTISMVRQMDKDDNTKPTEWLSHWDNDKRVRITMHEEVLAKLKADTTRADLAVKYELVEATETRAAYSRFVVITPLNIEATF